MMQNWGIKYSLRNWISIDWDRVLAKYDATSLSLIRKETIAETVRDWNRTREDKKLLFDNESGRLDVALSVQYSKLQRLSYAFTPLQKQTIVRRERMFELFISVSILNLNTFSLGGGFFYHDFGLRAEWMSNGINWGVICKF